ncbi:MAG TPA: restriction endonuclease subunit S, partial [bacterium]|nr:restriction endonuclease subunit S [bacterium]
ELLKLFTEVKQGKKPQDTKHSFCISKEQIETLDPRIAERIKKEVSEKTKEKNAKKREKLVADLDKKLESKKISKEMYDEKLWQFDNIVEGQIDNEVAKAIEKAHNYHFNLQNYRSNLSVEQIKDWQEVLKGTEIKNGSKIDKRYQELQKADPKIALQILASFDAQNALQMDIARGYLSKLDKQILEKDEKLVKLFEILKETKQFPFETLGELLIQKANKIKLEDDVLYRQVTIKLYGKGVFVRQEVLGSEIKTESQFIVNEGDFIMSKIDARNGAFGIVPAILDGAVVTSSFPYFEIKTDKVNPKYLEAIVTQKSFYDQINNMVSGATGRRSVEVDNFLELQIPLPPLEVQNEIVAKIEKQKQIIEGAERIEKNFLIPENIFEDSSWDTVLLSDICKFSGGSQPPKESFIYEEQDGYIRLIQIRDFKSDDFKTFVKKDSVTKFFNKDDVMIARYGPPIFQILRGMEGAYNVALMKAIPDETRIDKNYLFYYLQNPKIQNFVVNNSQRSAGQSGVNTDLLNSYQVFLPPLETQRQIVEKLDKQMQALEGVRLLKTEAEKRIDEILAGVWGE